MNPPPLFISYQYYALFSIVLCSYYIIRQAKAWAEESGFFLKVTNISGELRPLPKDGPARREHLKQALHKIQLSGGRVYLPSTPGTTVLGINYDGAAPMQSAAKSPILVPFLVEMKPALREEDPDAVPAPKPTQVRSFDDFIKCACVLCLLR